jgi:hypothetical protein
VQRSPGDAKHRPVTLLRRAGTHEAHTTHGPRISSASRREERRAAQHPGHEG